MKQQRARHRWGTAVVSATAFALTVGSQGAAVALPQAPAAADREFTSSFETDDPAPDWLNTVDTGPGAPNARPGWTAGTAAASRAM